MKKTIGIVYNQNFNEESFDIGCGGSEAWVIQIAKKFSQNGYHVIVFNNRENWYFSKHNVEYVPLPLLEYRCSYQNFEAIIFTRSLDETYEVVVRSGCTNKLYLQSHDPFVWEGGIYNKRFLWEEDRVNYSKLTKFIALTEFHKKELMDNNHIPEDMIEIIGNGLDSDIYDSIHNVPENLNNIDEHSILWTSAFGRGGDILVEDILPIIQKTDPNFKVHICGYGDGVPEHIKENPSVKFLGTLTKKDYYREFYSHFCWFLPGVVVEEFGICAAEAMMCNCDVISPYCHGMANVLWPFVNTKMENKFGEATYGTYHFGTYHIDKESKEYKKACAEAARLILESRDKYYDKDRIRFRISQKTFVKREYTWQKVVVKWIKLFNESL